MAVHRDGDHRFSKAPEDLITLQQGVGVVVPVKGGYRDA